MAVAQSTARKNPTQVNHNPATRISRPLPHVTRRETVAFDTLFQDLAPQFAEPIWGMYQALRAVRNEGSRVACILDLSRLSVRLSIAGKSERRKHVHPHLMLRNTRQV